MSKDKRYGSFLSNLWMIISSKVFNSKYVLLVDFDGQKNLRKIRYGFDKRCFFAYRFTLTDKIVILLSDRTTHGLPYVKGWEPYFPRLIK